MEQPKEEEAMEVPVCNGYTICTGGAVGTDSIAEQCARELGMNIEVMIPSDHVRAKTITPLSQSILEKEAEPFLNAAAQKPRKESLSYEPLHKEPIGQKLLDRP